MPGARPYGVGGAAGGYSKLGATEPQTLVGGNVGPAVVGGDAAAGGGGVATNGAVVGGGGDRGGGGRGGTYFGCCSGRYHLPSEACHHPSPWFTSDIRPRPSAACGCENGNRNNRCVLRAIAICLTAAWGRRDVSWQKRAAIRATSRQRVQDSPSKCTPQHVIAGQAFRTVRTVRDGPRGSHCGCSLSCSCFGRPGPGCRRRRSTQAPRVEHRRPPDLARLQAAPSRGGITAVSPR